MALRRFRSYTLSGSGPAPDAQGMVWSLSKDDDGLDSVLPLADGVTSPSSSGSSSLKVAAGARSAAPDTTPLGASPTVVVDPISQMPEAFGARPSGKRTVEPTVVLKGRKLDQLRAEVARHRTVHQRKKQRVLLLWAGAGGLALCLGWAVGTAFRPDDSEEPGADQSPAAMHQPGSVQPESAESVQAQPGSDASGSKAAALTAPEPSAPANQPSFESVDLTDLPTDDEAEKSQENSAGHSDAFTLDDLPLD